MSPDAVPRAGSRRPLAGFLTWLSRKILSAAFDLLYHQLALVYDPVSWVVSGGMWNDWRRSALAELPPGRILEVGSGTGHLLLELLESGRDAYGLDSSPEMLQIARQRLSSRGFEARLVPGDARRLPFGDATFDGLVLTFPAPFLDERFWREAARVLRPGGRLVIVVSAESRRWPWPGSLEWILARVAGGPAKSGGEDVALGEGMVGRLVERRVGRGVARLIVGERAPEVGSRGSRGPSGGG